MNYDQASTTDLTRVSIAGCATNHAAAPVNSVALDGLIAEAPLGPEWHQTEITAQQVVFERTVDGQRTTLMYSATPIAPLPDDEGFLRFAETQKGQELSKLEKVSVHYNRAEKKGVVR